jgi:hypothetical protein
MSCIFLTLCMAYNAARGHFTIHMRLAGRLERSPTIDETSSASMKCTYGFTSGESTGHNHHRVIVTEIALSTQCTELITVNTKF